MKVQVWTPKVYVPLLLAHLGVLAFATGRILSWSYALVLAVLGLTVFFGWRRLRLSVRHNRPLWSLLLLALLAQGMAFGLLFVDSLKNPQGTLVAFDPTFYFCLSSLLLVLTAAYNPVAPLYRWASVVDSVLACIIAALFYYTLHNVIDAGAPSASFVMWMFDGMDLFVALFATLRFVSTKRSDERRFFFVLTVFAWLDAALPAAHNRFVLSSESYLPELLLSLPFAVLGLLLSRRKKVWFRGYRPNRRTKYIAESLGPFVYQVLRREWDNALRTERPLSVAMIDIDSFKTFNDTYGHLAGDDCLAAVSYALQSEANLQREVVVARYGGEEFIALMIGYEPDGAEDILQRLRRRVESMQIQNVRSSQEVVTVSGGLASTAMARYPNSEQLLKAADNALYAAKRGGKNQIRWVEEDVVQEAADHAARQVRE
jgi:diguanylate cyclase (GGDEF)-like protein